MDKPAIRFFRHTLRRFERLVVSQFKTASCCTGVTLAQCHALMELDGRGALPLVELARGLGLDKSTLSRTVDGLVNIDLVARRSHPGDRRRIQLCLTEKGQRTCAHINDNNDALFRRVFKRIPPAERESVRAGFQTLVAALAAESGGAGDICPTEKGEP